MLVLAAVFAAIPAAHAATSDSHGTEATMLNDVAAQGEQGMNKLLHWAIGALLQSNVQLSARSNHPTAFTNSKSASLFFSLNHIRRALVRTAWIRLSRAFEQLVHSVSTKGISKCREQQRRRIETHGTKRWSGISREVVTAA